MITNTASIEVSHRGNVPTAATDRLTEKVTAVASQCRDAIIHVECRLVLETNPTISRPAIAEATLNVNGHPVRAHVAAGTPNEAIDLLVDRLSLRLRRYEDRLHRVGQRHNGPADRQHHEPEYHDVPPAERETRRRKEFALDPMPVEDAILELEQLDHHFFLFREYETASICMVASHDDGYQLHAADPAAFDQHPLPDAVALFASPPPVLDPTAAQDYLDNSGERVLFHRPTEEAPPQSMYRRYDGHYGLITPSEES